MATLREKYQAWKTFVEQYEERYTDILFVPSINGAGHLMCELSYVDEDIDTWINFTLAGVGYSLKTTAIETTSVIDVQTANTLTQIAIEMMAAWPS